MLKKYLNYNNAINIFLNISLTIIMCYTISLTLFLSMPPAMMSSYDVISNGILYMEYILCSIALVSVCFLIMKYIIKNQG